MTLRIFGPRDFTTNTVPPREAELAAELAAMTKARDLLAATAERLIAERDRYRAALREIKKHAEACEDDAELCRRDWIPMAVDAALRRSR